MNYVYLHTYSVLILTFVKRCSMCEAQPQIVLVQNVLLTANIFQALATEQ